MITTPAGEFEVALGADNAAGVEVAAFLTSLTDAQSPLWNELKSFRSDEGGLGFVEELDRLGLIQDSHIIPETGDALNPSLEMTLSRGSLFLQSLFAERSGDRARQHSEHLLASAEWLVAAFVSEHQPDLASCFDYRSNSARDALDEKNFYLLTIELQFRDWRQNCPAALAAVVEVLRRALDRNSADRSLINLLCRLSSDGTSLESVIHYLWGFGDLLSSSIQPGAERLCIGAQQDLTARTGLQFILEAERIAAEALVRFGPPRILEAINDVQAGERLIKGAYIQEYHVTSRFIGIITPMLSKRLLHPLRGRLIRYYAEEVGHEKFELETCESLGIPSEDLKNSSPLPLNQAFVDVFAYLATNEPVAYMTAIFLTEGMPRARAPLAPVMKKSLRHNLRFGAVAGRHEGLNDELNHASLSRLLLVNLPRVDPHTQKRALDYLLYLVELNYRTWDLVYQYYIDPNLPLHYNGPANW